MLKGESPERIAFCRRIVESLPGHLEGEASVLHKVLPLRDADPAARESMLQTMGTDNPTWGRLLRALVESPDAESYAYSETAYNAHIGTDCYLHFYDTRPIGQEHLTLPEDRTYTIQVIDTWNMTIETVAAGVSGTYVVKLPSRENMAVLALAE